MSLAFRIPYNEAQALPSMDHIFDRVDISIDDIPLLSDEEPETAMGKEKLDHTPMQSQEITETAIDQYSQNGVDHGGGDQTDINEYNPNKDDSILRSSQAKDDPSLFDGETKEIVNYEKYVPSSITNYYNEATLSSKKRSALPDDVFGVPRLRAYPLHDKAHIKQAVRMFPHCKDPKDREVLAKNIIKAIEEKKVDIKIGKKNPLYEYAPKSLQETTSIPQLTIDGSTVPLRKRTKEDVVKEHLRVNGSYYNNIFYGEDYRKSVTALKQFEFLEYFHPNVTRMNFLTRLKCVCGGLASPNNVTQVYDELGIRKPSELDFSKPLGWYEMKTEDDAETVAGMLVNSNYETETNWFKVDLSDNLNHIFYCLRLYSIMGEIFLNPNFDPEVMLSAEHTAVLLDWGQRVLYHYDLYIDALNEKEKMRQRQYLLDLFWLFTDNPRDDNIVTINTIAMLHNMACVRDQVISVNEANTPGEMISKDQCSGYLVHDLGLDDDLYLLPTTLQYPIIDKNSVRLAMDMIDHIPEEDRQEYSTNLNRKYREFGCNFSISVDHPYAKYADKTIILKMTHMLLEGDTAVDDQGTSTGPGDKIEEPFYKRIDYMKGRLGHNLATIKDDGPSPDKKKELDYEYQTGIV